MLKYSLNSIVKSIVSIRYKGLLYFPKDFEKLSMLKGEYVEAKNKWESLKDYEKIPLAQLFVIGKYSIIKTLTQSKNEWFIKTKSYNKYKGTVYYDFKEKRFIYTTSCNIYADLETTLEVIYELQKEEKSKDL